MDLAEPRVEAVREVAQPQVGGGLRYGEGARGVCRKSAAACVMGRGPGVCVENCLGIVLLPGPDLELLSSPPWGHEPQTGQAEPLGTRGS